MMPLLLWASPCEDVLATAGEAPALRLRIPGQVFVSTRDRLAGDSQEIQGGVGAPGSPSRGAMLEFSGTLCRQGRQQAEITRGKSVWLTEGLHGYLLGRPCADAGNLA